MFLKHTKSFLPWVGKRPINVCVYWNAQSPHEWLTLFLFCFCFFIKEKNLCCLLPSFLRFPLSHGRFTHTTKKSWSFKNNCTWSWWWWWWGHKYWKHPQSNAKFKNGFQLLLTTQNKTHNFTTFSDILYYYWIVFCQTLPSSKFSHSSLL